ncbi:ADP,ATP carrier protein 3 [Thelohanellus kitauei]|uniref:ADP/ATP translocase n=1 Tax=Thelohanellus kitauei TaxID=669202 RepID=A0A0C2MK61_THEKT|nr:ADP,ATP carrier protein 3 [Thelohanellus kitauei]
MSSNSPPANKSNHELSFAENFMLGGTAAAVSKTVAAPLERVKLLIQNEAEMIKHGSLKKSYGGFIGCVKHTYNAEGLLPFWRGNMANVIRYFPTQALNFSFLDKIKGIWTSEPSDSFFKKLYVNMVSGGCAGSGSLLFVYSLDYARTRLANDILQADKGGIRQFSGLTNVYVKTLKSDGIRGLYRGFGISCVGIFVYRGIYFGLYYTAKPVLLEHNANFLLSFLLAYTVTVLGETFTYPIDTVRRRMMMSSLEQKPYKDSIECAVKILENEGIKAYFKGCGANVLRGFAGAVLLAGFDKFKYWYVKIAKN